MIDMERVFRENGIPAVDSSHKHHRHGWINTQCPFCSGSAGAHLGWSINQQYFICWRCGWKPTDKVLQTLLSPSAAKDVLANYKVTRVRVKTKDKVATATKCVLPKNTRLNTRTRAYLRSRNFDPKALELLWELRSVNNKIANVLMWNRIIAPIYYQGRLVSYQTRDITGKAKLRYITASKDQEVVHHKHICYGMDQVPTDTVVVVEGITDVWRLGFGAVCTFGIKYTNYQVLQLSKFTNRYILFDTQDKQARRQGRKLADQLSAFDGDTYYVELPNKYRGCDPADLPQTEADAIMRDLKG
jgi:DNA primase